MFAAGNWARPVALSAILVSVAILPACNFAAPIGDPATSKADPALQGYWVEQVKGTKEVDLHSLKLSEDGHYYDFAVMTCEGTLEKPTKYLGRLAAGIAWLTEIDGERFVTVKLTELDDGGA